MNMMAVVCCGGGPRLWVIANQRYLIGGAFVRAHTHTRTVLGWMEKPVKKNLEQDVIQKLQ